MFLSPYRAALLHAALDGHSTPVKDLDCPLRVRRAVARRDGRQRGIPGGTSKLFPGLSWFDPVDWMEE